MDLIVFSGDLFQELRTIRKKRSVFSNQQSAISDQLEAKAKIKLTQRHEDTKKNKPAISGRRSAVSLKQRQTARGKPIDISDVTGQQQTERRPLPPTPAPVGRGGGNQASDLSRNRISAHTETQSHKGKRVPCDRIPLPLSSGRGLGGRFRPRAARPYANVVSDRNANW